MEPPFDLIHTILLLGAAQGIFLALVLLTGRRGNRVANRILAIALVLFSIDITLHTFPHSEHLYGHPHHAEIVLILFLLISPLIYLYARALTESEYRLTAKFLVHFAPFAVCALLFIAFQSEHDSAGMTHESAHMSPFGLTMAFAVVLQAMAYVFAALKALSRHARNIRDSFSSIERINLMLPSGNRHDAFAIPEVLTTGQTNSSRVRSRIHEETKPILRSGRGNCSFSTPQSVPIRHTGASRAASW